MAIAAEYKIGNTKIIINDEFCKNQTEESKNETIKNITRIVSASLREQEYQATTR